PGDLVPTAPGNDVGGRDQGQFATAQRLAQTVVDVALGARLQLRAIHVHGTAGHGIAGDDVLADRMFHEAFRGVDADTALADIGLADDAPHAGEVVDVVVRVDHRRHRLLRAVLQVQVQRGAGGGRGEQRINDDQSAVALEHSHGGQWPATELVAEFVGCG